MLENRRMGATLVALFLPLGVLACSEAGGGSQDAATPQQMEREQRTQELLVSTNPIAALAPAIVEELGNALCAPVVKFVPEGSIDPPSGAMRFSGSISLSDETFHALLDDIASSLRQHGFTDIVLIGDSGGNQSGMKVVAQRLNERWAGTGTRAHFIREYYDPGWAETERYSDEVLGVPETQNDGHHDDFWVTALMTITAPEQVRYDQRVEAGLASINGVDLRPIEATIELGRKMNAFRAALTVEAIRNSLQDGG